MILTKAWDAGVIVLAVALWGALFTLFVAWFTALPTIGLLWALGVLR